MVSVHMSQIRCGICYYAKLALIFMFCILVQFNYSVAAGNKNGSALAFEALYSLPLDIGIEDVCCSGKYSFSNSQIVKKFSTGYGKQSHWLKTHVPSTDRIIHLNPVLDDVTLYYQKEGDPHWNKLRTGDMVANDDKAFLSPFMMFELPDDIKGQTVFVRIVQTAKVSVSIKSWQESNFLAMQTMDYWQKSYMLGFVCAIILYNIFVSVLVRDPVFFANALCISSLLLLSLYLSGYGVMYFWPQWTGWSNTILTTALFFTISFGAVFVSLFLHTADEKLSDNWPFFIAPAASVLAALSAIILPFWVVQLWMLINGTIFLVSICWELIRRAINGEVKAYILSVPLGFAVFPGLILLVFNKVFGYEVSYFGNNLLEITLCFEAILFSLALAFRIRLSENEALESAGKLEYLQKDISRNILETIDSDRRRVAADLHDTAGQGLLAISSRLDQLLRKKNLSSLQKDEIKKAADYSRDVVGDIRRISHDLHPAIIDHLGWRNAIEELFNTLRDSTNIVVNLKMELPENALDYSQKLHLYRITQEAISNIAKHSRATRCDAHFFGDGEYVYVEIRDNGQITITQDSSTKSKASIGHLVTDQRIVILNGVWALDRKNNETIARFSFPFKVKLKQQV